MTVGPDGSGWMHNPQTVEQAYDALRFHCERLEELLEANAEEHNDRTLKRSDKAVTVMKVGFKILKKALKKQSATTNYCPRASWCAPVVDDTKILTETNIAALRGGAYGRRT